MQCSCLAILLLAVLSTSLQAQDGVTPAGVKYTILKPGTGPNPKMGQEVLLHIEALDNEGKVVFSTRDLNVQYHALLGKETDAESKAHDEAMLNIKQGSIYREEFPKSLLPADNPAKKKPGDYLITKIELLEVLDARPSGTDLIVETAEKSGIDAAQAQFKSLQQSNPKGYTLYEWDLNAAGYKAMEENKLDIAVAVFTMNTVLNPGSWNAYDSLGDAFLAKDDKANAKISFQKAVELNPKFEASQEKLSKL